MLLNYKEDNYKAQNNQKILSPSNKATKINSPIKSSGQQNNFFHNPNMDPDFSQYLFFKKKLKDVILKQELQELQSQQSQCAFYINYVEQIINTKNSSRSKINMHILNLINFYFNIKNYTMAYVYFNLLLSYNKEKYDQDSQLLLTHLKGIKNFWNFFYNPKI